jgi:hypothetical protein
MAQWHLPRWEDIEAKDADDRDPLERFIWDNTPSITEEAAWRETLFDAIFAARDSIAAFETNPGAVK